MSASKNTQSGFSMIELLVAVVILAVGLLGLAQLQVTAIKVNSQSMTSTASRAVAQKLVEDIAAMSDYSLFVDGTSGDWGPFVTDGGGTYTAHYEIDQVEANGNAVTNLFNVTITVESTTAVSHLLGARPRTVTISTLKRAI